MGRFLKIAVYVAVLFLGYLWVATVAKSCNKTASIDDGTEYVEDMASEDGYEEDFFEDEGEEGLDEMGGGSDEEVEEFENDSEDSYDMDYTEIDEIIEETKTTSPTTVQTSSDLSSSSGRFLLLSGSYLIESNAREMVDKLKKMGYDNAEIVVFDMSQYHSVCAGRYASLSSAKQESGSLKRRGVDNYVHTKQ